MGRGGETKLRTRIWRYYNTVNMNRIDLYTLFFLVAFNLATHSLYIHTACDLQPCNQLAQNHFCFLFFIFGEAFALAIYVDSILYIYKIHFVSWMCSSFFFFTSQYIYFYLFRAQPEILVCEMGKYLFSKRGIYTLF